MTPTVKMVAEKKDTNLEDKRIDVNRENVSNAHSN